VCAVVSGGNVDPLLLVHVVQHGLAAARRFLALRVTVPDRPGSLVGVLTTVSGTGANVIDVAHSRLTGTLALGEVEIAITVETRGAEHCSVVVGALRRAGYVVAEEPGGA
jgi:threonine dehydratase